jgi:hypothetical protein
MASFFFGGGMNLWLAASLFFGGALSHMVLAYYLKVHQGKKFVENVTSHVLSFMTIISWSLANALSMKYDALRDSDISDDEVQKVIDIDREIYEVWKKSIVTKAFPAFPRKYIKLLPTFDWDGALRSLDNIYYRYEEAEEQTDE